MSISEALQIDGMGIDRKLQEIVLSVSDHLSWQDVQAHLNLLKLKLENYVHFIKSGQLEENITTGGTNFQVRIEVVYQFEPAEEARAVLGDIGYQLSQQDIRFELKSFEALEA